MGLKFELWSKQYKKFTITCDSKTAPRPWRAKENTLIIESCTQFSSVRQGVCGVSSIMCPYLQERVPAVADVVNKA